MPSDRKERSVTSPALLEDRPSPALLETRPETRPEITCEQTLDELLRRAADRDWVAWDALVSRFERLVLHAGRRIGLNHADAADVAQLTWLRLLEHAHQIRQPDRLPAWLTATARREALRVAMSAKRYVLCADPTIENGVDSRGAVSDVYPVDGEYGPEVEEALARLPARYQQLLRLLMSDDCPSYADIARRMGLPIGSIGPMRMRALQMLRRTPEFADAILPRRALEGC
jgi:RNA polymerase sigma factor (sigma-70 family)